MVILKTLYDDGDSFSDGTRNPYNGSSDGEPMLYDGTSADSKTRGASGQTLLRRI